LKKRRLLFYISVIIFIIFAISIIVFIIPTCGRILQEPDRESEQTLPNTTTQTVQTGEQPNLKIDFYNVGIATCLIRINDDTTIAIDPALSPQGAAMSFKSFDAERTAPPIYDDTLFDDTDLWLITHLHEDHFDKLGAEKIDKSVPIIMHPKFTGDFKDYNNIPLKHGETKDFNFTDFNVSITAVPAYHASNLLVRAVSGAVSGYVIKISNNYDEFIIYFTSDSVYHKDIIKAVKTSFPQIDLLVANLGEVRADKFGGPLTMSVSMLEQFKEELNPGTVIPVHIDDMSHYATKKSDLTARGFDIIAPGVWHTVKE
jgi:L-ascorbate metabolism protein UlaG (beta-lactamase superfamily)